jgi:hypothetical protein
VAAAAMAPTVPAPANKVRRDNLVVDWLMDDLSLAIAAYARRCMGESG